MRRILLLVLVSLGSTGVVFSQGRTDYMNVESPQVHPIEVVSLGGHDYLVAVNTRNNTVEIFDTDESADDRLMQVVRVGLEPVTVRYNANLSRLFVANFLGDSISIIDIAAPGGPGSLSVQLRETTWVGDEPLDIAFYTRDDGGLPQQTLLVTHMALDGLDWRDAITLQPINGIEMAAAQVTVAFGQELIGLAAKEPFGLAVHGDQLFLLPLKGGTNSLDALNFDMDYYCDDLTDPFVTGTHVGGLGTTGLSMTTDAAGNLYIVGGEALNDTLITEPQVRDAATGFVRSMFWLVQNPCSANPTILARDVNLRFTGMPRPFPLERSSLPGGQLTEPMQKPGIEYLPVPKSQALSMLTDVALYDAGDALPRVYFTAFSNDRIGILEPDLSLPPDRWKLRRIEVDVVNGNPLAGPNGLALKTSDPARLYVLNHLDNSIVTIDPDTDTVVQDANLSLSHDPRPAHLTIGQQFLYDANLSAGGTVSCASCHVFGRTDRRVWNLGDPDLPDVENPAILPDGIEAPVFVGAKGNMVTQSLQGLLNFEIAPANQFWVTNAPYHWRGDRASFLDFNGAFASLLGGEELSEAEMRQYEEFINTIHYPPNPKQPFDRIPSGDFGVGQDLTSDGSTGAARGQKIFHLSPADGFGSCASGCHAGMEGSNNRQTEAGPIEVAALRGLYQKEAKRDIDGSSDPIDSPFTGLEGLTHTGFVQNNPQVLPGFDPLREINLTSTLNAFNKLFFSGALCGTIGDYCDDLADLNQFTHEFDWGVAPLVGLVATVTLDNVQQAGPFEADPIQQDQFNATSCANAVSDLQSTLACMELQAGQANAGIAVQAWLGGHDRGFWYDPTVGLYHEEPAGGQSLARADLVDQITSPKDRLVFNAVPLGSERRIAAPDGFAPPLAGNAQLPEQLTLLPMAANTFNARVPELTNLWNSIDNTALESLFLHTVRLYQWGLILDGAENDGFGLGTELRHDTPRRFRVVGNNIRHGASLVLGYFNGPNGPPDPGQPISQGPVQLISMPIYPTSRVDTDSGLPIWQTAIELERMMYYSFMLGGPWAPGVAEAFFDQKPFTFAMEPTFESVDRPVEDQFAPNEWNWMYVFVLNADGNFGDGGWQRLRIE